MSPNNEPVIRLMFACWTQWRVGFSGVTGLDYNAVFRVAEAMGIAVDTRILQGISLMEDMVMGEWGGKEKDKKKYH
jgi:hypothetical protein